MDWYLGVLRKYAVFDGRARRKEFWMFVLFNVAISIALSIIDNILGLTFDSGSGVLGSIYSLAVLIPSIAVGVRRLHDTGRSGWWILIGLIPLVGWIILVYFYILDGVRGSNQYGPDPKAGEMGSWAGSQSGTGAYTAATAAASGASPLAAAAWYADPAGRHQVRYWDGLVWTEHVADNGVAGVDPLSGPATATKVEHPAWPGTSDTASGAAGAATPAATSPAAPVVTPPVVAAPVVTPPVVATPSIAAPTPLVELPEVTEPAVEEPAVEEPAAPADEPAEREPAPAIPPTPVVTAPSVEAPEAPKPPEVPPKPLSPPSGSAT